MLVAGPTVEFALTEVQQYLQNVVQSGPVFNFPLSFIIAWEEISNGRIQTGITNMATLTTKRRYLWTLHCYQYGGHLEEGVVQKMVTLDNCSF